MTKKITWEGYAAIWPVGASHETAIIELAGGRFDLDDGLAKIAEAYARRSSFNCGDGLLVMLCDRYPHRIDASSLPHRAWGRSDEPVTVRGMWKVTITMDSEKIA